ncbi:CTP synthase [Bienertia sinuspersici]
MGKYIWDIANKNNSLWLRWISHHYMKGNIWSAHVKGYTVGNAYRWLSPHVQEVEWANWVWKRYNIPKHRFILWIIMWSRLRTRAKMAQFCSIPEKSCLICHQAMDDIDHLYVKCDYRKRCILMLPHIVRNACDWQYMVLRPEQMMTQIKQEVILRIKQLIPRKISANP